MDQARPYPFEPRPLLYLSTSFYFPNTTVRSLSQFPSIDSQEDRPNLYRPTHPYPIYPSRSFMFVESTDTSFITMQQAAREGIRNPRSVILTRETRRDNLRERVSTLIRCVVSSFRNEINRFSAGTN